MSDAAVALRTRTGDVPLPHEPVDGDRHGRRGHAQMLGHGEGSGLHRVQVTEDTRLPSADALARSGRDMPRQAK